MVHYLIVTVRAKSSMEEQGHCCGSNFYFVYTYNASSKDTIDNLNIGISTNKLKHLCFKTDNHICSKITIILTSKYNYLCFICKQILSKYFYLFLFAFL